MSCIIPGMVAQSEINECGLACVAMLAETQGINITLAQLRDAYPISVHGTSLSTLGDILSEQGISVYPVLFSSDEIQDLPLPAILHYGAGHYVLLAYRKGRRVCIMNPAIGQQFLTFDALKKEISGYALVVDPDIGPEEKKPVKSSGEKQSFLSCLSLKQTAQVSGIYFLMSLAFLVSLTLFIMPAMVGQAINEVLSAAGKVDFPYFIFLLAFVISTALALWVRAVTERCIKRFVVLNSTAGFSRLLSNSLRFFERRAPGEIFSRFSAWETAAMQKIELDNGLRTDWIIGLLAFIVMAYMSFSLALVSLAGVTLLGMVSVWAIYRDRFYAQQMQERIAEQNEYILESINGFTTIKSAGLSEQRKGMFARYTLALFTCMQRKQIYEQIKNSIYQLVGSLEMVLFMFLALPLLKAGALSLGSFFAYSFIRQIFSSYITRIFFAILQKNQLHVIDQRAADLFPAAAQKESGLTAGVSEPLSFSLNLRFEDIAFRYDSAKPTLHKMSLSVKYGAKLAIVGESGAGKSTLIKIIAGLLLPDEGQIFLDENLMTSHQISSLCFLQSQDDILFNASVLENITLFDPRYDDSQEPRIHALLTGLNLAEVVAQLPGGVHARIRESHTGLSLGQRQRLLLARAMYCDRPVLVLDEPTANLDDETALQVMMSVVAHCHEHGKTLIVVTHSKPILSQFDHVYMIVQGQLQPHDGMVMQECVA
ncbi:ATP-binding cassette domain-containing protein [Rahnella sp. L72c]|uniref:ATP-binding cassette domain-containing protein n=1 Tax=Rahnella perminowiae TaxID=2816244 RepID=A0ABS6L326_9GAMM|nr:ATP-binding cassette domain-containing protein [Rahnella perminowiae]MBU9835862.1 ATP-binding cassette domain-containing protein [Rahnella perminowiae]